jgi:hypothetical protein
VSTKKPFVRIEFQQIYLIFQKKKKNDITITQTTKKLLSGTSRAWESSSDRRRSRAAPTRRVGQLDQLCVEDWQGKTGTGGGGGGAGDFV